MLPQSHAFGTFVSKAWHTWGDIADNIAGDYSILSIICSYYRKKIINLGITTDVVGHIALCVLGLLFTVMHHSTPPSSVNTHLTSLSLFRS